MKNEILRKNKRKKLKEKTRKKLRENELHLYKNIREKIIKFSQTNINAKAKKEGKAKLKNHH